MSTTPRIRAAAIASVIAGNHLTYANEDDLQAGIDSLLALAGFNATREVRLSDRLSRIDLMSGTVGIEVKIKGSAASVTRQLKRYAECPEIDALILVTTKASHHQTPGLMNGKPVFLVSLIEAGL